MRKAFFLAILVVFLGSMLTSTAATASQSLDDSAAAFARVLMDAEGLIMEMHNMDVGLMKMGTSPAIVACGNDCIFAMTQSTDSPNLFMKPASTGFIHRFDAATEVSPRSIAETIDVLGGSDALDDAHGFGATA